MKRFYHTKRSKSESRKLSRLFASNQQLFLPFLELVERSSSMIGEVLDEVSRSFVEGLLELSATQVAGPPHQGRRGGEIRRHGRQGGVVTLSDRKVKVKRPRLRERGGSEVAIPAYESLRSNDVFGQRVGELMMRGVSTRDYATVIGELAETTGVSKSSVSREFIEASTKALEALAHRRFDDVDVLVIYIDGVRYGDHHVVAALGVDTGGKKHVLGIEPGASENGEVVCRLLEGLVDRGLDPSKRYLFVIDGSKALRSGIRRVFGEHQAVQRCRLHKVRNVRAQLPDELCDQVVSVIKAAFRLDARAGRVKIETQARWLEKEYPGAAASLREGIEDLFTINALGVSSSLVRCLATTNIIESPFGTMQKPTGRVTRWRSGDMVLRWTATSFLAAEKKFRRIMGYRDLWQLEAALRGKELASQARVA
jgi:transposase-like protein